ncbi:MULTISPECIES: helix-turn-helix transcriptional regulator [unclassified Leucobacter]|uniref:ArsR/SmtB family transcription factor n=1 Tax=unclassified Leucobacter TaxID=2621730 RepID=UPI00165DE0B0|nr:MULTISPECIES: metalloregulator ArsR/SmtB family transcription factor [unclassified Leucobacter]MBC9936291.1 helix-turn-helix transcriptional regulator [Leucobacter sp. cx-87]
MGKPSANAPLHRANDEELERAAQISQLLADRTRLGILELLLVEGEHSVGEIGHRLERPIPAVSQHLAKLKTGGLVLPRRDGTSIRYRIGGDHVALLVENLLQHSEHVLHATPPHHREPAEAAPA